MDGCVRCRRHKHSPNQRVLVEIVHSFSTVTIHHYSQSSMHSFHEWNWFGRNIVLLRWLQSNFDDLWISIDGFPCTGLRVLILVRTHSSGFPCTRWRSYICLPRLRAPRSITSIWIFSDGFPRTSKKTQSMTVSSETHRACRCSRIRRCWRSCFSEIEIRKSATLSHCPQDL